MNNGVGPGFENFVNNERARLSAELRDRFAEQNKRIKKRLGLQQSIGAMQSQPSQGGAMDKVKQINSYKEEAVAAELMVDLLIFFLQFCFNIPYWRSLLQYNQLLSQELEALANGEELRLVWEPDANGNYPDLYELNENGEIVGEKLSNEKAKDAPIELVRRNGYVPRPNFFLGLEDAVNMHIENMFGSGMLSQEQQTRLHGAFAQHLNNNSNKERPAPSMVMRPQAAAPVARR